jgi:hypothetical protein
VSSWNRDYLASFDGVQSNTIFCMWTGTNPMSSQRIQALWSIYNNTRCPVVYINHQSLRDWEKPEYPYHPAFEYLSDTHKSDYMRCYLMHHYGGGWADIKHTSADWRPHFAKLRSSSALALGYQEIPDGIPHLNNSLGNEIRLNHDKTIGLCAFIFKKQSEITYEWYEQLCATLDQLIEQLALHPATHPQDQFGLTLPNGKRSEYPIKWADILGEIFHPLVYKYQSQILKSPIEPRFFGYR